MFDETDPVDVQKVIDELDDYWDFEDEFLGNDFSDDADALASAGWGTDEDYGYFGEEDY